MSNHPSDNTKGRLLRRALAGILTLALMLGLLPASAFTAHAASWADPYVQTLVDWGVMRGDIGGNMAPDRSITRAEFVTMMNRAYGYTKLGGHPFTDVRVRDWYSEDIDIAYNIGYFKGTSDTTASPNDTLTREQAAVLLARNMMLQETVGETLGFSDTRRLSDWSRGLVGAAAANGIISGYEDGSFQPMRNITRGEVAAMLVRAIGTPIQSAGDHALGNVYGNVTVNTSGVKLRDGVIVGNLYLTGGIDLGDVLLENVTVLGEIIVSGGGESNSSQSSIILRNVVADKMIVDSIGDQFVTIRAEGNTDIPTTTVRTNAYVDDSSLPGYGLSFIELDGEEGALYQLAGNIKEVVNKTPGSDLQIVQGIADKVTVDEKATDSSVLVDGDAQVGELNLDTGTDVTGTGDIKDLNVGSAGSTVEQLPDNIVIRPGIDADIAGSNMDSTQGAESSADPKLLAGYPAVRKIAPQSAELVFRVNKPGTIYWAVSAVADGSVSEADLLEPPVYGNKVLASGKISATAANTDYTAAVSRLTSGGSYYVTAMLVDGRDQHSPIKVTSFSTPDNSVPAFAPGYPVMTLRTTEIAQATVMTTKSCLLYYALLPAGAKAPTEQEFKSAAIPGNLGYGSQSVTKNVTIPININNQPLEEKTNYVVYFWLVDHDGAQKSRVVALPFTTLDETPPIVTDAKQLFSNTTPGVDSIQVEYTIDEPADFVWAIVTEGQHMNHQFLDWKDDPLEAGSSDRFTLIFDSPTDLQAAKVQLASGQGALVSGTYTGNSPLTIRDAKLLFENAKTSSFVLYYIADDNATNTGNLSEEIKGLRVRTLDTTPPDASLRFNSDGAMVDKDPQSDADVHIVFTEQVKGTQTKDKDIFLNLYQDVLNAEKELENAENTEDANEATAKINSARNAMAKVLDTYIELHQAAAPPTTNKVTVLGENDPPPAEGSWIDWRKAEIAMVDDGSGSLEIILPGVKTNEDGTVDRSGAGIQLEGGVAYYFRFRDIYDLAYPAGNSLVRTGKDPYYLPFTTSFAKINVEESDSWEIEIPGLDADRKRIISFLAEPVGQEQVGQDVYWDMLIWTNTTMEFSLYSRPKGGDNTVWTKVGGDTRITVMPGDGFVFAGMCQKIMEVQPGKRPDYKKLRDFTDREYVVYINSLEGNTNAGSWNYPDLQVRVSFVAGTQGKLSTPHLASGKQNNYDTALSGGVARVEEPSPCYIKHPIEMTAPPEILSGYPKIDVTDTSATITLSLDREGSVRYLVTPMQEPIYQGNTILDPLNTILTNEEVIKITDFGMEYPPKSKNAPNDLLVPKDVPQMLGGGATTYQPGIEVSFPDEMKVTDGKVADRHPQGVAPEKGSAGSQSEFKIDLTDRLSANTVYYLFLITQSTTSETSVDPVCYRFTTSEPQRPTIQVRGGNKAVDVYVDKTTQLDYFVAKNGEEGSVFHEKFGPLVDKTQTWYSDGDQNWSKSDKTTGYYSYKEYHFNYQGDLAAMPVIDAMATAVYQGSLDIDANYRGSVFDLFASGDAKQYYVGIIQNSNVGDGKPQFPGTKTCTGPMSHANNIPFNGLTPGSYTFVSTGKSDQGSGYAFRAYYSIRVTETPTHPTVTASVNRGTDWGWDNLSGTIMLVFSDPLFFQVNDGTKTEKWKLDTGKDGNHPSADKQKCLGDIVSTTSKDLVVQTDSIHTKTGPQAVTLNFTNFRANEKYYCIFSKGLCDTNEQGANHQLKLTFEVKTRLVDPDGGTPDDMYEYYIETTIETEDWDGTK